jgi:hypothetical protein
MQQQPSAFNKIVNARLDHLSNVRGQLTVSAAAARAEVAAVWADVTAARANVIKSPRAGQQSHGIDRPMKLILFGVSEDKDTFAWRPKVNQALQQLYGTAVDVSGMFSVDRFAQNKVHPILVNLRVAWYRGVILNKFGELKEFNVGQQLHIFVDPDKPLKNSGRKSWRASSFVPSGTGSR